MNESISFLHAWRRKGALVDANVLLVYAVGKTNRTLLSRHKHTKQYAADFELIESVVEWFDSIHVTPNVLTEVSNLGGDIGPSFYSLLKEISNRVREHYCDSASACADPVFTKLGLTDAALAEVARQYVLVTFDLSLYSVLRHRGIDAINVHHLIQASWMP